MINFTKERWVDIVYNLARFEDIEVTREQAYNHLVLGKSISELEGFSFHDSMVLKNIFSAYYYVSRYGNMGVDLGLLITDIHEIRGGFRMASIERANELVKVIDAMWNDYGRGDFLDDGSLTTLNYYASDESKHTLLGLWLKSDLIAVCLKQKLRRD